MSEAFLRHGELPSGVAELRILMGGSVNRPSRGGSAFFQNTDQGLYCFPASTAPGSMAMHGSSPHHLFFVMRLLPVFSTGGLSLYVTDDSIHKPPKYPETSHQHV